MAFVASFLLLFNIFFFSAIFPISQSETEDTIKSVIETSPIPPVEKLDQDLPIVERLSTLRESQDYRQVILKLLGQNLLVMGLSSVPFVGIVVASIAQFENGRGAAAFASSESIPQPVFILILYAAPPFWMELLAYSTVTSVGLLMIINRKSWREEFRKLPKAVTISATLLVIAAVYETIIIASV